MSDMHRVVREAMDDLLVVMQPISDINVLLSTSVLDYGAISEPLAQQYLEAVRLLVVNGKGAVARVDEALSGLEDPRGDAGAFREAVSRFADGIQTLQNVSASLRQHAAKTGLPFHEVLTDAVRSKPDGFAAFCEPGETS